jgi:hypothetical protein
VAFGGHEQQRLRGGGVEPPACEHGRQVIGQPSRDGEAPQRRLGLRGSEPASRGVQLVPLHHVEQVAHGAGQVCGLVSGQGLQLAGLLPDVEAALVGGSEQ